MIVNFELDSRELRRIKKSIKHPHFYYAIYYPNNGEIRYVKKKWYQWLSGRRIVVIKLRKDIELEEID